MNKKTSNTPESYSQKIYNKILDVLDQLSITAYPILVEGKRDKKALQDLNINGEVLVLNRGHSIIKIVDDLSHLLGPKGKFIILTDWDRTGGNLYRLINDYSRSCDLIVDNSFRKKISLLTKNEIHCVEHLPNFLANLNFKHKRYSRLDG